MSNPALSANGWKVCSICKKELPFEGQYYLCSVSTCQRKRTGLYFCSPACFEAHLPMMRHRDAWAEQAKAPTRAQAEAAERAEREEVEVAENNEPKRRIVTPVAVAAATPDANDDVLVVVSKLKKFIRDQSGMNTSDSVVPLLSRHLRELSIQALRVAAADNRKTVLDRDFDTVLKKLQD